MFKTLLRMAILGVGLTPSLIGLLMAGIMLGKPQPCQPGHCPDQPYGAEVLILPSFTLIPLVCGFLVGVTAGKSKRANQPTAPFQEQDSEAQVLS